MDCFLYLDFNDAAFFHSHFTLSLDGSDCISQTSLDKFSLLMCCSLLKLLVDVFYFSFWSCGYSDDFCMLYNILALN